MGRKETLHESLADIVHTTMGEKSLDTALELKLKGNDHFKSHEFREAIDLYTAAIEACPSHR